MTMFNKVTKTFQWGNHTVTMETGEIARQATGAVLVDIEGTVVLATVVCAKSAKPGQDFFPLTVDYLEKTYAAGKIPGSFFKREAKPSEFETLTSRLIDRPIRPLFPEGFYNEVQLVIHVVSLNPEVASDIAAMIASSAALSISGIPFNGPIGAARVAYINGEYVLNPSPSQMAESKMDLIVAGTESAVLMVESEADQLSEDVMLGGVVFGHEQGNVAIQAIHDFVRDAGKPAWDWLPPAKDEAFIAKVNALAEEKLRAAYQIRSKQARTHACRLAYAEVKTALTEEGIAFDGVKVEGLLFDIEAKIVRSQILAGEPRIDGRDTRTVRPIEIRTGVLPRVHGSALFTRGETQALVVSTLGTEQDAQRIDALTGDFRDSFLFHYNMPPFATGETGRVGSPKRREIGHGRLAKRALVPLLQLGVADGQRQPPRHVMHQRQIALSERRAAAARHQREHPDTLPSHQQRREDHRGRASEVDELAHATARGSDREPHDVTGAAAAHPSDERVIGVEHGNPVARNGFDDHGLDVGELLDRVDATYAQVVGRHVGDHGDVVAVVAQPLAQDAAARHLHDGEVDPRVLQDHPGRLGPGGVGFHDKTFVDDDAIRRRHADLAADALHDVRDHPRGRRLAVRAGDGDDRHSARRTGGKEQVHHGLGDELWLTDRRVRVHPEPRCRIHLTDGATGLTHR